MAQEGAGPDRTVVKISFKAASEDDKHVTVEWTFSDPAELPVEYRVDSGLLEAAGADVRAELKKVAKSARIGMREKNKLELLAPLAAAGAKLFDALFTGVDEQETGYAADAREWYERNVTRRPDARIDIEFCTEPHVSPRPLCPWGLVYPATEFDPAAPGRSDEVHDRFWAVRHRVTSYERIEGRMPRTDSVSWREVSFYAFVGDASDYFSRGGAPSAAESEPKDRTRSVAQELGTRLLQSKNNLRNSPHLDDAPNTLYYVNRRGEDDDPDTKDDLISPTDLRRLGLDTKGQVLAVLDGASVTADKYARQWYTALQEKSWSAFIATEVDLEGMPLDYFGLNILSQITAVGDGEGSTLFDIVDQVRRSEGIRPWGLLFGLYSQPERVSLFRPPDGHFRREVNAAIDYLGWGQPPARVKRAEGE